MALSLALSIILTTILVVAKAQDIGIGIGVCYGQLGDNLVPPPNVVALYKQYNIKKMRIYQPDPAVLDALKGTGIDVIVGTYNSDVAVLAQGPDTAQSWFGSHIQPYLGSVNITYISVGNEVYPGLPSSTIAPAMKNVQAAIDDAGFHGVIKVSTVVSMQVLGDTFPPSKTVFADPEMAGISKFLQEQGSELLGNVYPYFPYVSNVGTVRLDYAQFNTGDVVVQDGDFRYTNLFDSMVDSFYWAMEKVGVADVGLVVTETGWPHGGGDGATTNVELAANYNKKLVQHLVGGTGTPKRPNKYLQGYIFAMFDENNKPAGVEQFWGVFQPSGQLNYNPFN